MFSQVSEEELDHLAIALNVLLRGIRLRFGMDVAFVSEFVGESRVFRVVDASEWRTVPAPGDSDTLEESYCYYIASGEMPQVIPDALVDAMTSQMGVTDRLGIRTYLGVPIPLKAGQVYGTLCAYARRPIEIDPEDVAFLTSLAALVGHMIEDVSGSAEENRLRRRLIVDVLENGDFHVVYQPMYSIATGRIEGVEALSRFPSLGADPAAVFAEASRLGIGVDLEVAAVEKALSQVQEIPGDAYLSVNLSAEAVLSPEFDSLIASMDDPSRLVVEVTEHSVVRDYDDLVGVLGLLGAKGVRLAVDDVGAGVSGLDHILRLGPQIIKLDGSLVQNVHRSSSKQALLSALVAFASRRATTLVAEMVELPEELAALRILGVSTAQGYLLARPGEVTSIADRVDVDFQLVV